MDKNNSRYMRNMVSIREKYSLSEQEISQAISELDEYQTDKEYIDEEFIALPKAVRIGVPQLRKAKDGKGVETYYLSKQEIEEALKELEEF